MTHLPYFSKNIKFTPPSGSSHLLFILLETLLSHRFSWLISCDRNLRSKVTFADRLSYRPTPKHRLILSQQCLIYPPLRRKLSVQRDPDTISALDSRTYSECCPSHDQQLLNEGGAVHNTSTLVTSLASLPLESITAPVKRL